MRLERIDPPQMRSGDGIAKWRGLGLHHPSGIMGQGVYSRSELKRITRGGIGKPIFSQPIHHIRKICSIEAGSACQDPVVTPSKGIGQENGPQRA